MSKPATRVGLIVAGYVVAFTIASAVVAVYVIATSGPDRRTYGAMFGCGDSILFLAVFGAAAMFPSGAALFFLRPYRSFWLVLSVVALGFASTGVAALVDYVASRTAGAHSILQAWSALAVPRILAAPLFALGFLVAGLFAPNRSSRIALLVATAVEAGVFACLAYFWIPSFRSH